MRLTTSNIRPNMHVWIGQPDYLMRIPPMGRILGINEAQDVTVVLANGAKVKFGARSLFCDVHTAKADEKFETAAIAVKRKPRIRVKVQTAK